MPDIIDDVTAAWDLYASELARLPNVVTVGMGHRIRGGKRTRIPALVVTVRRKVAPEVLGPSDGGTDPSDGGVARGARGTAGQQTDWARRSARGSGRGSRGAHGPWAEAP
jgi:hypothetical protein